MLAREWSRNSRFWPYYWQFQWALSMVRLCYHRSKGSHSEAL